MARGPGGTLKYNPSRRRKRRKSRKSHRRGRRKLHKRYGRGYRKNPGSMLIDLAKRAVPVLIGLYGARLLVKKIGPMIPGTSALGSFAQPALAVGAVFAVNIATKKVAELAKYRNELLLGVGMAAIDALVTAFAPASVKGLLGVGDIYDQMGDYVAGRRLRPGRHHAHR